MEIGSTLKGARVARGMSLDTAEEGTKIRRKYLEAMENENFKILPGRVYVKGFLKNYARYLGLAPEPLAMAFDEQFPEVIHSTKESYTAAVQDEPAVKKSPGITGNRRLAFGSAALALLLIAGITLYNSLGEAPPQTKPPAVNEENRQQAQQNPPGNAGNAGQQNPVTPPPAENPPRVEGVNVALNVTASSSWMQVVVDGKNVFTGEVRAGQTKTFKGQDKIFIRLGNAGVVEVNFNGRNMGFLGDPGKVVNKEFTNISQG